MHCSGVGVHVGETEGVMVGCSDGMRFGKGVGVLVNMNERNKIGAIVPRQIPHLALQSSFIFVRRSVSSE